MQFGLKMIKFSKCKNYFIKPINCFVQMFYKAGAGFVVFVKYKSAQNVDAMGWHLTPRHLNEEQVGILQTQKLNSPPI